MKLSLCLLNAIMVHWRQTRCRFVYEWIDLRFDESIVVEVVMSID